MKKHLSTLFAAACAAMLAVSCSEEPSVSDPTNGPVNAQSYVAIGNSVTAGVQSGALYIDDQIFSYPNLIAGQIGAEFVQPLMGGKGTGERITLKSMNPVTLERATLTIRIPDNSSHTAPYNNLGVPLAVAADLADESDLQARWNPMFRLILRDQVAFGKSVLTQAVNLHPTFVTIWIGNNDILTYALSGGTEGTNATGDLPTDRADYHTQLRGAVDYIKLRAPNVKAVLGNIPDIQTIPFFTTVPPALVDGNGGTRTLYIEDSQGGVRSATPADIVLLSAQPLLAVGFGSSIGTPLPDRYALDPQEQSIVAQAVADYNAIIDQVAHQNGYAVADIHGVYQSILEHGYSVAGETFTTEFISGGLFSLDGIHPSSKGSGLIANEFIRAMNAYYGANIRYVDIAALPGIPAPLGKLAPRAAYSLSWKIPAGCFDGALRMVRR